MSNKKTQVLFKLSGIRTEQFGIIETVQITSATINLAAEIDLSINESGHAIVCRFKTSFRANAETFLILAVACLFSIEPRTMGHMKVGHELRIPKGLAHHLGIITVGTARGVLHAKTEGTLYNRFVLPTINIEEQIQEDIIFQLDNSEPERS